MLICQLISDFLLKLSSGLLTNSTKKSMPSLATQLLRVPGTSLHRRLCLVLRDGIFNKAWLPGSPFRRRRRWANSSPYLA